MNTSDMQRALNSLEGIERHRRLLTTMGLTMVEAFAQGDAEGDLFLNTLQQAFDLLTDFEFRHQKQAMREALDA